MDIWGVGCVLFEVLSLFPLFPGNNELDQVHKIHNILGTPAQDVLDNFQKYASHMEFNFPPKVGTGISQLIPHVSPECQELITKLLAYTPDDRLSARQALNHPWFREFRAQEKKTFSVMPGPDDRTDDEQRSMKRSTKGDSSGMEYQRSIKRIQQGSNKASELKLLTMQDKHNTSADSDEPNPTNVTLTRAKTVVSANKGAQPGRGHEEAQLLRDALQAGISDKREWKERIGASVVATAGADHKEDQQPQAPVRQSVLSESLRPSAEITPNYL